MNTKTLKQIISEIPHYGVDDFMGKTPTQLRTDYDNIDAVKHHWYRKALIAMFG